MLDIIIPTGMAAVVIAVFALIYYIFKSPFSYPYFRYEFDVSGKRGFEERIGWSILRGYRERQYERAQDDGAKSAKMTV